MQVRDRKKKRNKAFRLAEGVMLYTAVKQHGKPLDSTNSTWVASDRSFATVRGLDALVDAEDDVAAAAAREGAALEVRAAFAACAARGCCSMTGTLMSRPPPLGCARCRCERVRSHGVAAALAPAPAHMCVRVCMSHRETQRERETERQRERETHTHTHTHRETTPKGAGTHKHTQIHRYTCMTRRDKKWPSNQRGLPRTDGKACLLLFFPPGLLLLLLLQLAGNLGLVLL